MINKINCGAYLISLKITFLGWEINIFEAGQILLTGNIDTNINIYINIYTYIYMYRHNIYIYISLIGFATWWVYKWDCKIEIVKKIKVNTKKERTKPGFQK